jgi:hypothetical protein
LKKREIQWGAVFLGTVVLLLALCAGTVRLVDPFFHYHAPDPEAEVWFDARGQSAGLLRSQSYETVFMGSSLAANYRPFWFDVFYDTSTVKVNFPDGGFGEFSRALDYAYARQDVKRVIFGLDPNLLARAPAEEPAELMTCLYDDNPWNDTEYLLNKDVLMRSGYTVWKKLTGQTQSLQDAFMWDGQGHFTREEALASYQRPEQAAQALPADYLLENGRANLAVVTEWVEAHPDTEFIFWFSPYSILFWDKMERTGMTDAMLTLLDEAARTLLAYDNVELQFFMTAYSAITDLNNYSDHIHVAGRVTYEMAESMPKGTYRLTEENREETLDGLRDFVVNYDYDRIFAAP